jgi:hypothetical protein
MMLHLRAARRHCGIEPRKTVKRGNRTLSVDLHCTSIPRRRRGWRSRRACPHRCHRRHGTQRTPTAARAGRGAPRRSSDVHRAAPRRHGQDGHRRPGDLDLAGQYYYRIEPELGRRTSRLVNERLAEIVSLHPDRFVALGTLPMQDPQLAVAELEYCMKTLGFRGIELGTNVRKAELSDGRFNPVFAKAEEMNAVIFLHPSGFTDTSRLGPHFLTNVIGNPLDTTVALAHIVYGGVLERYPGSSSSPRTAAATWATTPRAWTTPTRCGPSATTTSSARLLLHEEDLFRHHGVQPHAARAPGEPVGREPRRDRHRLSRTTWGCTSRRFRERAKLSRAQKGPDNRG